MNEPKEYTITLTASELLAARVAMDHYMYNCDTLYGKDIDNRHSRSCESSMDKLDNAWMGRP